MPACMGMDKHPWKSKKQPNNEEHWITCLGSWIIFKEMHIDQMNQLAAQWRSSAVQLPFQVPHLTPLRLSTGNNWLEHARHNGFKPRMLFQSNCISSNASNDMTVMYTRGSYSGPTFYKRDESIWLRDIRDSCQAARQSTSQPMSYSKTFHPPFCHKGLQHLQHLQRASTSASTSSKQLQSCDVFFSLAIKSHQLRASELLKIHLSPPSLWNLWTNGFNMIQPRQTPWQRDGQTNTLAAQPSF